MNSFFNEMALRGLQLIRTYGDVTVNLTKVISVHARSPTSIAMSLPMSNWFSGNWLWQSDDQKWHFTVPDAKAEVESIKKDLNAYYNREG